MIFEIQNDRVIVIVVVLFRNAHILLFTLTEA